MRTTKLLFSLGTLLCFAAGCERFGNSDDPRARQTAEQGEQRAEQLRSQANEMERNARDSVHQQAEQMRDQAQQVERQAQQRADQIRAQDRAAGDQQRAQDNARVGSAAAGASAVAARGGGPAVRSAMEQYANARCDREQRCDNVGVGKRYRDRAACVADQLNDRSRSWEAADECRANGVNANELNQCLSAASSDDCRNPFDDVSRANACRAGEVCGR